MARIKQQYQCSSCGSIHNKWAGQCGECKEWNSLTESVVEKNNSTGSSRFAGYAGQPVVQDMQEIQLQAEPRNPTGITELDRVLGGGLVAGSVVLMGGNPGIGKSTLLTQTLATLGQKMNALYVTGEESLQQVTLRARRLNLPENAFKLLTETCVERIIKLAEKNRPQVMVIDSIQTVYTELLQSAPGAVAQVRESAAQLVRFAKQTNTALFLVGHVTKEGTLAGPRVLEHMVDTVLYFEGDSGERYRMIRAIKNRFGAVNELGLFAMTEQGLKAVSNPSAIFLSRHEEPVAGSVITVTREGNRPLLVEVQALVDESHLGNPRRVTLGLDQNRLSMLLAVLQDVFINVVGGVRVSETAADTAMLLSILSSFRDRPLPRKLFTFGEIGLAGEIRPVPNGQERLKEAAKHGFTHAVIPKGNMPRAQDIPADIEITALSRVSELLDI